MKFFHLLRYEDESGVSGVGVVAAGVQLPSGKCVMEWLVPPASMGVYNRIEDVEEIHGHKGKTRVVWGLPGNSTGLFR